MVRVGSAGRCVDVEKAPLATLAARFGHGVFTTGIACPRGGLRHVRDHITRLAHDASVPSSDRRIIGACAALRRLAAAKGGGVNQTGRIVLTAKSYWVSIEPARRTTFHDVPAPFGCRVVDDPRAAGPWPKHTARPALDVLTASATQGGWGGCLMLQDGRLTEGTTFHIAVLDGAGLVVPEQRSAGTAEAFASRHVAVKSAPLRLDDLLAHGGIAMNALLGFAPLRALVHEGRPLQVAHYDHAFWWARKMSRAFFQD